MRGNETSAIERKNKEGSVRNAAITKQQAEQQRDCSLTPERKNCLRFPTDEEDCTLGSRFPCFLKWWRLIDQGINGWISSGHFGQNICYLWEQRNGWMQQDQTALLWLNFDPQNYVAVPLSFNQKKTHHNTLLLRSHIFPQPSSSGRIWQNPAAAAPSSPSFPSPVGFSSSSQNQRGSLLHSAQCGFAFCWAANHAGVHADFVLFSSFPATHVQKLFLSFTSHSDVIYTSTFLSCARFMTHSLRKLAGVCCIHVENLSLIFSKTVLEILV